MDTRDSLTLIYEYMKNNRINCDTFGGYIRNVDEKITIELNKIAKWIDYVAGWYVFIYLYLHYALHTGVNVRLCTQAQCVKGRRNFRIYFYPLAFRPDGIIILPIRPSVRASVRPQTF